MEPVRLDCQTGPVHESWKRAMGQALDLAEQAANQGDVPVGAVVLDAHGQVMGRGCNRRQAQGRPLAHAEMEVITQAASAHGPADRTDGDRGWDLSGCTMVVTLEPCPMCIGAILACHFDRVVFGAWDPKMGACGSVWDIPRDPHTGPTAEVIGGVEEGACADLLSHFFKARRQDS